MRSSVVIFFLVCLIFDVSLGRGQQPAAAPATPACSPTDACKEVEKANSALSAAQSAADSAQKLATQTDAAKTAAQAAQEAATKAAADARASAAAAANSAKTAAAQPAQKAKASKPPLGDYVPCLFDSGQNYDLRALADPAQAATVTDDEAQKVASTFVNNVISATPANKVTDMSSKLDKSAIASSLQGQKHSDVGSALSAAATKLGVDSSTAATASTAAQNSISGGTFERPDDVSCSFSILQWQETSDTFGRRVANQYVAIQVNIRNLNTQNEFLVHDIQIAVDTGLSPEQFGRWANTRDKLIVRDVAQRGQTEDRRNLVINSLQMVGAIAGGASGAVTQSLNNSALANNLSTAIEVFQGPFITGLINIFPDHTVEHINHINDLVFSASSTNKTVVPVQGSVPLVTFLAEKPLEQLPFARCGQKNSGDKSDDKEDTIAVSSDAFCDVTATAGSPAAKVTAYTDPLHYKKWMPAAVAVLERRVFVVIAGVHIKEVANEPTFTSITCAPGNDTTIALAKITTPMATCALKGKDLDLVSQVELQNSADATDKIEGTSSVIGGDTTQSTVQFSTTALTGLKGTSYTLYYLQKAGGAETTKLTVTVQQAISFNPTSLTFSTKAAAQTVTLTNNTDKDLNLTGVDISGGFGKPTGSCFDDIKKTPVAKQGGMCTIIVTLNTTPAPPKSATLNVSDDGPGSPQTVQLTLTTQ